MKLSSGVLLAAAVIAAGWGYGYVRYLAGWYAHSEQVNAAAEKKRARAAAALQVTEVAAAGANADGRVIYRTVYRDVVKYVNNPARTKCQFDPDAVRLRQRSIDAANHIPGFDAATVSDE